MKNEYLTKATIEQARALWDAGHSSAEIGRRMGRTKNSIVSMAHRHDFAKRADPIRRIDDDLKRRIVEYARNNPTHSVNTLAARCGVNPKTAMRLLTELDPALAETKQRRARPAVIRPQPPQDHPAPASRASVEHVTGNTPTDEDAASLPRPAPEPASTSPSTTIPNDQDEDDHVVPLRPIIPPNKGCQWPEGHPGLAAFRYCGDPKDGGRWPYCAKHHRLARALPPQRRTEDAA